MKRKLQTIVIVVLLFASMLPSARCDDINKSYQLPVLTVTGADFVGACEQIDFTLIRKAGSKEPLTIAIAEDTPGGAGESVRASVWLAAMVAGMNRLDDLSGVKISLQLPGQVDGNSAGGVICLAILSALNRRDLPKDMVMTGTIMPDGTIGAVGGIVQKMQAAAASGAKRILLPAYLRFEKDLKTGQETDLKQLALSLKLDYVPVESIAQAYDATHSLTPAAIKSLPRDLLDLPQATEELLKGNYKKNLESGKKLWDAIPKEEQDQIAAEPGSRQLLIDVRTKGESAFRSGHLLPAVDRIQAWRTFLEARSRNKEFFATLNGPNYQTNLKVIEGKVQELAKSVPDPASLLAQSQSVIPESGTQFCAEYYEILGIVGLAGQLETTSDQFVAELAKPENNKDELQHKIDDGLTNVKAFQLLLLQFVQLNPNESMNDAMQLAGTIPPFKLSGDPRSVERLFYSAFLAASNSFMKDVVKEGAKDLNVTEDAALATMMQHDTDLVTYASTAQAFQLLHKDIAVMRDHGQQRFTYAAAAHTFAVNLATVSGLIVRWNDLEVILNSEGAFEYGRSDILNHLLNQARQTALENIAACKVQGIPCIQPIDFFETAELERDAATEDKVTVLGDYWKASLQAKVLLMLGIQAGAADSKQ
jgi:hypothetical protein